MTMRKAWLWSLLLVVGAVQAQPPLGGPPPEARAACSGKTEGSACSFTTPRGPMSGTCRSVPEGRVCVPAGAGGQSPRGPGDGMAGLHGANIAAHNPAAVAVASRLPDTHQGSCFDDSRLIPCPRPGERYYGQDAHYSGAAPAYQVNGDGTVTDRVTGLMWQQGHNARRLGWYEAGQACAALSLGGHRDWRLPNMRELFSIADFRGSVGRRPYLDDVFEIREPDAGVLEGDRFAASHHTGMMGQTWSATLYTGDHWDRPGMEAAFFMNFLDGHIKQAPTRGRQGLFYRCVRGPAWGGNDYVDNGDGTVTDRATGLVWQQVDDGRRRNWADALAYCEGLTLSGHDDWRLPNVKELQSIVDYSRHDPALDTRFLHQSDRRGWFWSSTTHGDNIAQADYVCFGKCTSVEGVDVHGAGAQRSDPKRRGLTSRTGQGGQNDEIRIDNYARCVR
jgi:hypothetical protein